MSDTNKIRKEIVTRLSIVYLGIVVFALIIIGKVVYLQVAEHDKWSNVNETSLKKIIIEPDRGDICAHDGRVMATSVPYYEIRMDLRCPGYSEHFFNQKIDSLAYCLSKLFGDKSATQYKRNLVSARYKGARYHLIKRRVDYIQLKELKTFPIFRRGQYKGGLIIKQENRRIQPFVNLASRTIGYESQGGTNVGIEGAFNKELTGEQGVRMAQRIAGNFWMPISDENEVEPKNGKDIITTIDINLQDVAHQALKQQLVKHSASHGTAVLMEVETGDIKAIVNLKKDKDNYTEGYNFAIAERTEPGSTIKLASLMAALEDGYIDLDDSIDTGNGVKYYYDHPVRDTRKQGKITVQRVFEVSSNVGVTKIITDYYTGKEERFVNRLKNMGLMETLGVEIKGERAPYIKFPNDTLWSGISLPMMSYGYEIEQTPLQILTFYNAVANNGKMMRPRFVKGIADHGKLIKEFKPNFIKSSICSKATIEKAKKMLEGVVENGTAQNLKTTNYKIAGKTGTAQIANEKYGYKYQSKKSYQASFVGYFPADNPMYSCIVVVNAPTSGVYYGNLVAGQVFKEIADKVYSTSIDLQDDNFIAEHKLAEAPYSRNGSKKELETVLADLNIKTLDTDISSEWIVTQKIDTVIKLNNRYIKNNLVPNVKGMGAKDALFILENLGFNVVIKGRGSVGQQSLQPDTPYRKGQQIVLNLI